ncbi:hypothetical protein MPH_09931 [Macrophomina phaseolina MS6]|uniref:Ankyrin repeat-containing domain protein n=1 Tax=Macrophomina phaseolina (strain MS6) TaxID=1126212 RepID=K2RRT1_MACPH|nr:hypothetical protein MPH_09931 [Macrophomina phaseolina MS6]
MERLESPDTDATSLTITRRRVSLLPKRYWLKLVLGLWPRQADSRELLHDSRLMGLKAGARFLSQWQKMTVSIESSHTVLLRLPIEMGTDISLSSEKRGTLLHYACLARGDKEAYW